MVTNEQRKRLLQSLAGLLAVIMVAVILVIMAGIEQQRANGGTARKGVTPIARATVTPRIFSFTPGAGATPNITPISTAPDQTGLLESIHPNMTITDANIHAGVVFNSGVADPAAQQGVVDYVWGSSFPGQPPGVYNGAYNPFDRVGNGKSGPIYTFDWFKANHPTWIEYKCDRKTAAFEYNEPNTPLDITNPDVINFLMEEEYIPQIQQGFDSISFDNVSFSNYAGARCGHFDGNGHWVQQFSGDGYDVAFVNSMTNWSVTIYNTVHSYSPQTSIAMNFQYDFHFREASNILLDHMDILADEQGFTNWGNGIPPYITDDTWLNYATEMAYVAASGKGMFFINEEPSIAISRDQIQWAMANYLLVKGDYSFLTIVGTQEYGKVVDHPEYRAPIGSATNAMYRSDCSYRRDYSNGLTIVNPSSSNSCQITLPDSTYFDVYGNPVSSQKLGPHSGLVLLLSSVNS